MTQTAISERSLSTKIQVPGSKAIGRTLAAALVAAADFLLYGHLVGISLFIFLVLLAASAILANALTATRHEWVLAGLVLVAALAPLVETVEPLSVLFGIAGVAAFALLVTGNWRAALGERLRRMAVMLTGDPWSIRRRFLRWRNADRSTLPRRIAMTVAVWLMPVALGLVFVTLFSLANPVFWSWVSLIDLWSLLEALEPLRLLFWVLIAYLVWTFVRVPLFTGFGKRVFEAAPPPPSQLMGTGLITRSLLVFNLIFALQTLLDAIYVWGGAALPEGVTPAADAQKSAYLLIVSALLAAAFVLVAIREDGDARTRKLIHSLIYVWIAQNVVLVLSAMLRLDLYIEIFSLTRLRLAAFVWMALVATGLTLIVVRIVLSRSGSWLIRANLVSLAIALYGWAVFDTNALIADYNVAHSREISGQGVALDREYLCRLGPSALPAIGRFAQVEADARSWPQEMHVLDECARLHRWTLTREYIDWRGWTFRDHRLRLYLASDRYAQENWY